MTDRVRVPLLRGYLLAAGSVAMAFAIRLAVDPLLGDRSQFILFVLAVLFSALFLGRAPAVLAAALSLAAGLAILPLEADVPAHIVQIAMFLAVCAGIILLAQRVADRGAVADQHRQEAQEKALRAEVAAEELRLLLEGAHRYAIFFVAPDGVVRNWNRSTERLYGWPEAEILGWHCSVLYPPDEEDSLEVANDELRRAVEAGGLDRELWQRRKDGSEFLASVTITPLIGDTGELKGFVKIIYDKTDDYAAEQALERRERHLNSILATVPDAMIVIDERGIMISFSATAERLFGYSESDVVGKNVSMLMPSPDREQHDSYLERYLSTRVPHIIGIGRIVSGLRADGSTFPMKLSVGETISNEQRLFTGFIQDLTERRDFEAKLEQARSELIHVSRLSAMGTMASTLAHELNQPLTAISAYGEAVGHMLERGDEVDRETLHEAFTEMAAQAVRAGSIVKRLRQFVARGEVSKSVEDLPALINEASALALVGTKDKGISAQFFYAPDATPVFVDRVQIQQVLVNLMRNAIEAMDSSPVRKLSVTTALQGNDTVLVTVADTGAGLAPEMKAKLFEAFASTKETGMGLGLSICRTIVEAHGGRIMARDAQGGGTEFQFTLKKPGKDVA
jgi:two-component system sensor kinase FixL